MAKIISKIPAEILADARVSREMHNPKLTATEKRLMDEAHPSGEWRVSDVLRRYNPVRSTQPLALPDRPGAVLRTMASNPSVFAVEDFANADECAALIAVGRLGIKDAQAGGAARSVRTNRASERVHFHVYSTAVRRVLQRATALLNTSDVGLTTDLELQVRA